jgi:dTDP-4-amino-4,6-dideoxygalactose transaminase
MQELGFNYRLTEIQSELGLSQLNRLDGFINRRRILVQNYLELLEGNTIVRPAQQQTTLGSAHHIFPIRINFASSRINRNNLMKTLKSKGIGTQVHYIPIPLQPYYNALGFNVDDLPNAVDYYFETLTIPLFPRLKFRQQEKIIFELNNGLST